MRDEGTQEVQSLPQGKGMTMMENSCRTARVDGFMIGTGSWGPTWINGWQPKGSQCWRGR